MLAVETPLLRVAPEKRASDLAKLNCAGRGCPERKDCRRYETRIATGKVVSASGYEMKTYTWGSFDVERSLLGNCESLVRVRRA